MSKDQTTIVHNHGWKALIKLGKKWNMREKTSPFYTREVNIFSTESPEALKTFTSVHSFLKQLLENI